MSFRKIHIAENHDLQEIYTTVYVYNDVSILGKPQNKKRSKRTYFDWKKVIGPKEFMKIHGIKYYGTSSGVIVADSDNRTNYYVPEEEIHEILQKRKFNDKFDSYLK